MFLEEKSFIIEGDKAGAVWILLSIKLLVLSNGAVMVGPNREASAGGTASSCFVTPACKANIPKVASCVAADLAASMGAGVGLVTRRKRDGWRDGLSKEESLVDDRLDR